MGGEKISKKGLFTLLMLANVVIIIVVSYKLLSESDVITLILAPSEADEAPMPEYEYYIEDVWSDFELLWRTISSALDTPPREVPEEEDVLALDPELFTALHHKFLPNLKNPCWYEELSETRISAVYENNTYQDLFPHLKGILKRMRANYQSHVQRVEGKTLRLRCLPYFYIIGQQKSGTSDLYHRLFKHPELHGALIKEPHWWGVRGMGGLAQNEEAPLIPLDDYLDLFDWASMRIQSEMNKNDSDVSRALNVITGEASSNTLWRNSVWPRYFDTNEELEPNVLTADFIHAVQPDVKFVAILRDPVERLYSEYLFQRQANESAEDFHEALMKSLHLFQTCLSERDFRWCVYEINFLRTLPVNICVGMYVVFLTDWMTVFPRGRFHVLRTEDYEDNLLAEMGKIYNFLDVAPLTEQQEASVAAMPIILARSEADKAVGDMFPVTREILVDFYRPFNEKLSTLLKNDAFLWSSA